VAVGAGKGGRIFCGYVDDSANDPGGFYLYARFTSLPIRLLQSAYRLTYGRVYPSNLLYDEKSYKVLCRSFFEAEVLPLALRDYNLLVSRCLTLYKSSKRAVLRLLSFLTPFTFPRTEHLKY
jgi:hypothetical protein